MPGIVAKMKPRSGFAHIVHIILVALLPAILFVLVRINFDQLALALILLSKWRMFAVRPRHWPANIRANSVDLIVGISTLVFMTNSSNSATWQLIWAVTYALWLLLLKPRSDIFSVSLQAAVGQLAGLMAIFLQWSDAPLIVLVAAVWAVCYSAARHFFVSFEEPYTSLYAHVWGYFGAALTWVLGHWLLFYGALAQPTLLIGVIGYGLATLYYLDQRDRLSVLMRRQFVFIMIAIVTIVLVFSNWGDRTI